jgi:hypothetical protein
MAATFSPLLLGVTRELTSHNGGSNRCGPVHHVDLQSASTAPPDVWRAAQDDTGRDCGGEWWVYAVTGGAREVVCENIWAPKDSGLSVVTGTKTSSDTRATTNCLSAALAIDVTQIITLS